MAKSENLTEESVNVSLTARDAFIISVALRQHYFKMTDDNGDATIPEQADFVKDLYPLYKQFESIVNEQKVLQQKD